MTQFEQNVSNLLANLEAERQAFESERLMEIRSTTLETFRREQEAICDEGIAALQKKRDEAISQKEEELKAALKAECERKFGAARSNLEMVKRIFADTTK